METKVLTQDELTQLRNLKEQQQNILMDLRLNLLSL